MVPHSQSSRGMACQLHAAAQEANGAAAEAQGCVPPPPIATGGSGRAVDQPDTPRLGELLDLRMRVLREVEAGASRR